MVRAGLLAILFGWKKFLVLIGASADAADELLEVIRVELETNELLLQDFPEVCYPIRCLEGMTNRQKGATLGRDANRNQMDVRSQARFADR